MAKNGMTAQDNVLYISGMEEQEHEFTKEELEEWVYKLDEENVYHACNLMLYKEKELLIREIMNVNDIKTLERLRVWVCYVLDKMVVNDGNFEKMALVPRTHE